MASITDAVQADKWGKDTEKQLDAKDLESWRKQIYVDTIPWEHERFRQLLEGYSKIPWTEVTAEILKIVRDREGHPTLPPNLPSQLSPTSRTSP